MILFGCANKPDNTVQSEGTDLPQSTTSSQDVQDGQTKGKADQSLNNTVKVENLTFKKIQFLNDIPSNMSESMKFIKNGSIISMDLTNENDFSVIVHPIISANITAKDNYGNDKTEQVILSTDNSPFSTFIPVRDFSFEGSYGFGLAGHEKRHIFFYADIFYVYKNENDVNEILTSLNPVEYRSEIQEETMISDLKPYNVFVKKCKKEIFLPADEIVKNISTREVLDPSVSEDYIAQYLTGSILNNTQDQWNKVVIGFYFKADNYPVHLTRKVEVQYIDRGKSIKFILPSEKTDNADQGPGTQKPTNEVIERINSFYKSDTSIPKIEYGIGYIYYEPESN